MTGKQGEYFARDGDGMSSKFHFVPCPHGPPRRHAPTPPCWSFCLIECWLLLQRSRQGARAGDAARVLNRSNWIQFRRREITGSKDRTPRAPKPQKAATGPPQPLLYLRGEMNTYTRIR